MMLVSLTQASRKKRIFQNESIENTTMRIAIFVLGLLFANVAVAIDLGDVTEKHVMIPMRDGVRLSANLYTPKGKGPWPAIYEQRYAQIDADYTRKSMAEMASHGYVVCLENFRGAQKSEGKWVGYRALGWGKKQDGYDTVEWLAKQSWCNGKVGTFGSSQAGFAQNFLAVTQPPHLVCQYMIDTGLSLFHEGYRIGGTTRPDRFKGMDRVCRVPAHNREVMAEWFRHPTYDKYWEQEDCTKFIHKMNVPCFTVGSWYDFMSVGSIDSFVGRQHRGGSNSKGKQQLILGPWLHGRFNKENRVAQMLYPKNAKFEMRTHMIRWFDHYLKGKKNGVTKDPVVRYYVMGAVGEKGAPGNEWRTAKDWPIESKKVPFYLRSKGLLSVYPPREADAVERLNADPLKPAKIPTTAFPGARDARDFEKQDNVLTFSTPPLRRPIEWTGRVKAELYVSSSAPDSDFIVRVSDVYPDGRSILIIDYVRRARYREGFEKEVFMKPGKVYKIAFDVGSLSQIFNVGHKIRVTVASTGAPFFEPNPNTGKPLTIEFPKKTVVAKNQIHVGKRYSSRIIAPAVR